MVGIFAALGRFGLFAVGDPVRRVDLVSVLGRLDSVVWLGRVDSVGQFKGVDPLLERLRRTLRLASIDETRRCMTAEDRRFVSETGRIAVGPYPELVPTLVEAVEAGGGIVSPIDSAEALIWAAPKNVAGLFDFVHDGIRWVQLPFAGIEGFASRLDHKRVWTCGKGVYAEPVAEHALALTLAGFRQIGHYARQSAWSHQRGQNLLGARVLILGGGGIAGSLIELLAPWRCDIRVLRRTVSPMVGVSFVGTLDDLDGELPLADVVVIALSLTPETTGLLDADRLAMMRNTAWLVNVGRGRHIRTDALVDALSRQSIGGAALDVTDPEPLPDDHPLWGLDNCIITPHLGNTLEMGIPLLADAVRDNVRRWVASEPLDRQVSVVDGY